MLKVSNAIAVLADSYSSAATAEPAHCDWGYPHSKQRFSNSYTCVLITVTQKGPSPTGLLSRKLCLFCRHFGIWSLGTLRAQTSVIFEWIGSADRSAFKTKRFDDDMCLSRITSAQFDINLADRSSRVAKVLPV